MSEDLLVKEFGQDVAPNIRYARDAWSCSSHLVTKREDCLRG